MARPARPWFRFYVEAFNDRKLLRLTPTQRWVWVAILGAARESCVPGELWIAEGVPMTTGELAHYAGVKEREITPALKTMDALGMVNLNGVMSVTNWDARQYESDNVTARTAKHRSKERSNERPNPVSGNAPDTETETDTERPPLPPRGKTAISEEFVVTPNMVKWVTERYPTLDWHRHTEGFVAWAKANDKRYSDWNQAWRNWMHRKADDTLKGWQ